MNLKDDIEINKRKFKIWFIGFMVFFMITLLAFSLSFEIISYNLVFEFLSLIGFIFAGFMMLYYRIIMGMLILEKEIYDRFQLGITEKN